MSWGGRKVRWFGMSVQKGYYKKVVENFKGFSGTKKEAIEEGLLEFKKLIAKLKSYELKYEKMLNDIEGETNEK